MLKKHSEQPSEDKLDSSSRLDSTYRIFVQNFFSVWNWNVKISVCKASLKNSNLHAKKKISQTYLFYEINGNISNLKSFLRKKISRTDSLYEISWNNS